MPIILNELNLDEALRYMGCPPDKADQATLALARACGKELLAVIRPRWTWKALDLSFEAEGLHLGPLLLPGEGLKGHLTGCRRAALFCVTLGGEADNLIRRSQVTDMARAFALDACAAAAVEQVCDAVEDEIKAKFPGCFFPSRYSPGYGDLPLEVQSALLTLLDAQRKVGLTATASHILLPRKSVTAILGVADHPIQHPLRSCSDCPVRANCGYRKTGGHCGLS